MQENTETTPGSEVSPEEIKAFMNEPDEPEEVKAPPPMMMDDFLPADEEGKPREYKLTTEEIASIAYHAVQIADHAIHKSNGWTIWDHLDPAIKMHYVGSVNFYMNSAANPNGHEACQALHDLMLDAKLHDGWRFGETYSEELKTDPTLLSYKGLPVQLKTRSFLFRCVVVGLLAVWKGH